MSNNPSTEDDNSDADEDSDVVEEEPYTFQIWTLDDGEDSYTYEPPIGASVSRHSYERTRQRADLYLQAQKELKLLHAIMEAQRDPKTGTIRAERPGEQPKPLHLHESAEDPDIPDQFDANRSCIFRVHAQTFQELLKIRPEKVQEILRSRHILVYGCDWGDEHEWSWCRRSMERLTGNMAVTVEVQGQSEFIFTPQDISLIYRKTWSFAMWTSRRT